MRPTHLKRFFRAKSPLILAFLAFVAFLPLASCERTIGQGVLLWTYSDGEVRIPSGAIVPVYIQSNIERVYVIGTPDGKAKVEVPLWQVKRCDSRGEANAYVEKMGALASMYAIALKDGLPIRAEPSNLADRVYRMRVNQLAKLLEKVDGEPVMTGDKQLPGDWYRVLADDGTEGYIFSYTVELYDEAREALPTIGDEKAGPDDVESLMALLYEKPWRPKYFREMLDKNAIDTDLFVLRYGLFADSADRQLRIETPELSRAIKISAVTQDPATKALVFGDTGLAIKIESAQSITVEIPDPENPEETLKLEFVAISENIQSVNENVVRKRQNALEAFLAGGTSFKGPFGSLSMSPSGDFSWSGYGSIEGGVIPANAGTSGALRCRLELADELKSSFVIALSFKFSGASGRWINFAVKRTDAGLLLVPLTQASLEGALVISAPEGQDALEFSR